MSESARRDKKRSRIEKVANAFLPISEAKAAARSVGVAASSIGGAVGAVAARFRAVLRRESAPQPTVADVAQLRDEVRRRRFLRGARVRWVLGVGALLLAVRQFAGMVFVDVGALGAINFALSGVLCGLVGIWVCMVAARDACIARGWQGADGHVTNLEVLQTPRFWVPW